MASGAAIVIGHATQDGLTPIGRMKTALLTILPLLCLLASFAYVAWVALRTYKASGLVSGLGLAISLVGLAVGRYLGLLIPRTRAVADWVSSHDIANRREYRINAPGDLFSVYTVETALAFMFIAAFGLLGVTLTREDAVPRGGPAKRTRRLVILLAGLFLFAAAITARRRIAEYVAYFLVQVNLL